MAIKYNLIGKRIGKLTVQRLCEVSERPTQNHGNYWLCRCDCGKECKVPTTYLTGKSNYTQTSCGCERKKKAFSATSYVQVDDNYLEKYNLEPVEVTNAAKIAMNEEKEELTKEVKAFKVSQVISPVYGIKKDNNDN